ncbi:hypothetical protein PX699_13565 [Sphingobium sp. H39-3-25]|uniref:hypothetical protein n=1 Tax=Sphingobium arseniciresistens TaxID=3030834 RepID=UPI0023B92742|nr:hypothetical protein [Sphingobium arseniciresistens]
MMGTRTSTFRAIMASATAALLCGLPVSVFARGRTEVTPYLEVDQTVIANLKGGSDDILSYTNVAAGIDASVSGDRAAAQASLRYEHQFSWQDDTPDQDVISGLARGRLSLIRNALSLEGGVIATRVRTDGPRGAVNGIGSNIGATNQIYSAYVGPTLATRIGALSVNAAYRLGYTRVDDKVSVAGSTIQPLDSFDDSLSHYLTASVGMQPGVLPFGWSVGGGWQREDARQLDQRFDDKWVRGDVTLPVGPTLALVGGVGYEKIEISARDAVRDASGNPVIGSDGRYVTDKSAPRLLNYDQDGLIWDAGVLWRPSRRTSLEARVGHRYGSWTYIGSFSWAPSRDSSLNVGVFDAVDSFGRMMTGGLANLSTSFAATRNPFSGDLNSCAFSASGGGQCFNDALSSVGTGNFRRRGIGAQFAVARGATSYGIGAGYSRRKFVGRDTGNVAITGTTDENYYANASISRQFDNRSGIDATIYGNYYVAGLDGLDDVLNAGGYITYHRTYGRSLTATASVGVDAVDPKSAESVIAALAQLGLRYSF